MLYDFCYIVLLFSPSSLCVGSLTNHVTPQDSISFCFLFLPFLSIHSIVYSLHLQNNAYPSSQKKSYCCKELLMRFRRSEIFESLLERYSHRIFNHASIRIISKTMTHVAYKQKRTTKLNQSSIMECHIMID